MSRWRPIISIQLSIISLELHFSGYESYPSCKNKDAAYVRGFLPTPAFCGPRERNNNRATNISFTCLLVVKEFCLECFSPATIKWAFLNPLPKSVRVLLRKTGCHPVFKWRSVDGNGKSLNKSDMFRDAGYLFAIIDDTLSNYVVMWSVN